MRNARATRMITVTAMTASLIALHPPAQAQHQPNFYCSESGDLCQSTRKVDGRRKLTILLAEKYFRRYSLCVKDPMEFVTCVDFKIQLLDNGLYGDTVRWRRHFPQHGQGRYVVKWYRVPDYGPPTDRIGEKLGFHVR